MKKQGIKREYFYLLMVILLGLILSSFIKPFMEGFKEGAETTKRPQGSPCNGPSDCNSNQCIFQIGSRKKICG